MDSNKILWLTEIKALDPEDGQLKTYCGPEVEAASLEGAQKYCQEKMPWCWVIGQIISHIPCKEGTTDPDWDKRIDYKELDAKPEPPKFFNN